MNKRPTGPFWDASHDTKSKKTELDLLKLNPPRDKDNADHRPAPPGLAPGGESNRAARGASGYKKPSNDAERGTSSKEIDITKGDPETDLWIHGKINSMDGYRFAAKVYDLPSPHGIDQGRISKLQIWKDDRPVASYDRGWDQKPETSEHKQAVAKVRDVFDEQDRAFTPIASQDNDPEQGQER